MSAKPGASGDRARNLTPGLERSCASDWVRTAPWQTGIQRIEAFFSGKAYAPHRHDTYSIGYTIQGVQSFDYRGVRSDSVSGQIIVLHPDEVHDGEAGTSEGFHYQMLYIEPSLLREALDPAVRALPFVKDAVLGDPNLLHAIHTAFSVMDSVLEPVALAEIVTLLADGLTSNDASISRPVKFLPDLPAVRSAREYLDANFALTVGSDELEVVTDLDRYTLTRQFRKAYGTSPYRYLTMRPLDRVRAEISAGSGLAEAALNAGFSDQAHMTRRFKAAFGIAPGRWRRMLESA
ncbi:transcriptional activator FtrA [Roseovarius sp. THAF8]|uniref:AraC family transcriptional regulator n=1 Tax=Roseovarius sp. THAF8 TaxID=2587846 RepID=UPI0012A94D17|nr:AraC family transcriptional regulator [Roseovarius sp. THAF8]QFT97543.1 transcriptional activator FtrA [Roseovarius sp. THAF8]